MKTQIDWTADEFGRARVSGVHDGRIFRFAFVDGDYVHLSIASASGSLVAIELSGVREMNVRELCNGSIVSAVYVWKVRSVPASTWDTPDSGWNVLFGGRLKKADAKKVAAKISLNRPQALLVQVECSYGGSIAAVCNAVSFFAETT